MVKPGKYSLIIFVVLVIYYVNFCLIKFNGAPARLNYICFQTNIHRDRRT